ncbi:uncharacterized protein LOC131598493 [Vicia villosa]|uniref:uncharacterized protein LOC131598493 n=1 Tax=Vicia villosa TaxID=3911 RepID=UPI00273B3DE3|nr:uncharacterized protein LOC131598493 [Vicia villosa]
MAHKYAIESLDRTLKDVMSANKNSTDVFGGKVVVFGGLYTGDFNNAGEIRDYYNANSVDKSEIHDPAVVDILMPEFLSSLRTSSLPNHHLKLKVGTPIMLMRNIDQSEGLCNGTRLCITKMAAHVLEASIMGGKGLGNLVYIPRMDMSPFQSP